MPLVVLEQAMLSFGHVALLDRVDFQLDEGERIALIGRNGGGKSSLMRVLAGLEKLGAAAVGNSPEEFRKKFTSELAKWKKVVEDNKIQSTETFRHRSKFDVARQRGMLQAVVADDHPDVIAHGTHSQLHVVSGVLHGVLYQVQDHSP